MGLSIEFVRSDMVGGLAPKSIIKQMIKAGVVIESDMDAAFAQGGHEGILDFPPGDEKFHNYKEMAEALKQLETENPNLAKLVTLGKSLEGREILGLHINSSPEALRRHFNNKPGLMITGGHHAREHLSMEMPLMFAQFLMANKTNPEIAKLLDTRDIWLVPMVNPDGAEFDISTGRYQMWRKNRRQNSATSYGVDLNRNYPVFWGGSGSSSNTNSDTYRGTAPFSEPETAALKNFFDKITNIKIVLNMHTFSELVLYPWGGTFDDLTNAQDLAIFQTMAKTMAAWNKYKPEQASDLYVASGISDDWLYRDKGIFAMTFELSPSSMFGGGFYPGAKIIDTVFAANVKPFLYALDVAHTPSRVLNQRRDPFLDNLATPEEDLFSKWDKF